MNSSYLYKINDTYYVVAKTMEEAIKMFNNDNSQTFKGIVRSVYYVDKVYYNNG